MNESSDNKKLKTIGLQISDLYSQMDPSTKSFPSATEIGFEILKKIPSTYNMNAAEAGLKVLSTYASSFSEIRLSELGKAIYDFLDDPKALTEDSYSSSKFNLQLFAESTDDYVTVDKKVVKEWDIPESVTLPIGHNRVKIKTELLVTILLTLVLWLADFAIDAYREYESSKAENEYRETQLQLSEEENQLLREFLNSIDASTSEQSESIDSLVHSIEDLTESLQASDSVPKDSDSSPDQVPESRNNSPE